MIPIGQPYRPAGTLDVRSILITVILGTTAAVLGAGLVWFWEISPIPTLMILTPCLQGFGVGLVMAFVVGRLRLRNPRLVGVVAFACGLLSIGLVHYGHYLHMVHGAVGAIRQQIASDPNLKPDEKQTLLARLDEHPDRFLDAFLVKETGHTGFVGSLISRNQQGVMLKNTHTTGWALWALWAFEALAVAALPAAIASERAGRPFCEDCGYWCEARPDLLVLPGASAGPLVEAVREDDPDRVMALRAAPAADDGSGMVGVTLHACPACDQAFADVSHRIARKKETKITVLLARHRVSPALVQALEAPPAPPTPAGPEDGPTAEADDEQPAGEPAV